MALLDWEGCGIDLWKVRRKGWGIFKPTTRFEVGNEGRIKLWRGVWYGDVP